MKVIPPTTITAAMLTGSSIAEPDASVGESVWVSGATYPTVGTLVILTSTHRTYYKLTTNVSTNLTVSPSINTVDWIDVGATNRWAMFDTNRTSGSLSNVDVTVTLTPSASTTARINSIAIVGCIANSVTINITSGGSNVYSKTTSLVTRNTTGWYKYFYGTYTYKASVVLFDLPPIINSVITLTFDMPAVNGVIGNIIIGNFIELGDIQKGISLEALNFSKIDRDSYGNSVLVPRRSVPRTVQKVMIPKTSVNRLIAARDLLNATPALWAGVTDNSSVFFEPLLILGIYKEFSISMDYPDHAIVSLQLEEM